MPDEKQPPDYNGIDPRDVPALAKRGPNGRFLPGNELWRAARFGNPLIFETPDQLLDRCVAYFEWVDENPVVERKILSDGREVEVGHPRPMTIEGLRIFLGIAHRTYQLYRTRDGFADILEGVEDVIRENKFSGAAVGIFNAMIIARDLGLTDKAEVDARVSVSKVEVEFVAARRKDPDE